MTRVTGFGLLALGFALLCGNVGQADAIVTDANIVSGLDISESIAPDDLRLEIEGMAHAIRSPEVIAAIQGGRYGRIGFAVFAWHHDQFPVVVPWAVIASEADAMAVAREIEARLRVNVETEARANEAFYIGRLTNLSQAIDHAAEMIMTAPYAADRAIVNIIGNGEDNVGEEPGAARERVIAMGGTVNGVVLGDDPLVLDYYRQQVIGGPGAFLIATDEAAALLEVLTRKFLYDIVVATRPTVDTGGPAAHDHVGGLN
jgi:Ca-activated chloride channel homolog